MYITKYLLSQIFVAFHMFHVAMACYPDVQRKAQKELDEVIGPDRLPELGDREKLPYIELICKEVYRWQQVDPTAFIHLSAKPNVHASGPSSLHAGKRQTRQFQPCQSGRT
ncbi:hypothetical protein JB92DRAFT_2883960 [Gautieria morchelliformis]|nr:hypothetical protein JB92DRAFT_2883960 [Gautieria morchelliformis]